MELFSTLIGVFVGAVGGYVTAYLSEKAKNRALKGDIASLTEEKSKVEHKYELEASRRKHHFERKHSIFEQYFVLLDQISAKQNEQVVTNFLPAISKFSRDFELAGEDNVKQFEASSALSDMGTKLIIDGNKDFLRLKQETYSIRLMANEKTNKLLTEVQDLFEKSFDMSSELIKNMPLWIINGEVEKIGKFNKGLESIGQVILNSHNALIQSMRDELQEI
jgi:hypothetical protein